MVCQWFGLKVGGDGFSRFGLRTGGFGFPGLSLKTVSYSLVIWASKSPRWFLGLGLKTKRAMVCRLCHKIDGRMKTTRGTRRDLVACFSWKQVRLGFPTLKTGGGVARMVHAASSQRSRGGEAKRWTVQWRRVRRSGSRTKLPLIRCNFPFSPKGHSSLLVFAINRTLGLLWEASLSHPLGFRSSFRKMWCVIYVLEKSGEK
jgi:hypothetical protein